MAKTASQIADRALTLIDEQVVDILDSATTEMSVKEMALEILPEVCRSLIKELPYELKRYLAETAILIEDPLIDGELQTGYIKQKIAFKAPDDFWELVTLRMAVWSQSVTDYILIDSSEYIVQSNPFTRAGKQNPVVAVTGVTIGLKSRIECFSIESGDSKVVNVFEYVSFNNIPDDVGNTWADELFNIVTKALATELNLIKSRTNAATITGEETLSIIEQHE